MAVDSVEIRKGILHNIILNDDYGRKSIPFIQESYFSEKSERVIFDEITKYYTKFNSIPAYQAIRIEIESRNDLSEGVYNEIVAFCDQKVEPISKPEYLFKKTEQWCQERAIVNAVYQAVDVITGEDKKTAMSSLPTMLQDAISTSFDKSVGHDFIDDVEDRWEFYKRKEEKIPTNLEHLNYVLRGGIPTKTLGVLMAGTGVGKSLFMCSISAGLIESGNNVLYITLEMAEEKIAQRIDQNLLNLTQEELDSISEEAYLKRFANVKMKTQGNLIVKEYPTKSAHAGHFKALLKELEQKKDFKPDVICIDYLNICASMNANKQANSYEQIKSTAEELRALSMEFGCPVLTATQTNRTGYSDADVDITSVSESFGLPMTADYFFALSTNDKLRDEGIIRFTQLKNRYGDPADRRNWLVGVDYSKMKVFDIANQPETIHAQNEAIKETQTNTSSLVGVNWG